MVITVRCKLRFVLLYFIDECNFIGLAGFLWQLLRNVRAECTYPRGEGDGIGALYV
jgi:hypothetical protein